MRPELDLSCARCGAVSCTERPGEAALPSACPMTSAAEHLEPVRRRYAEDEDLRRIALAAARTEAAGYGRETRIEEIMGFARRLGASHLGLACCVGTRREAALAQDIFEAAGFRVSSVACKVGSIPKEEIGIGDGEQIRPGTFEPLCNPLAQAALLEAAGTELNVVVGLCVGHDSLFFRHSHCPATVLFAKDRVTGHNPAAVLYTSRSYYKRLRSR